MKRTEWLDSWRGIGCLMVFASHALDNLTDSKGSFLGKSGVAMLFILSAYLLCELYYWNEQKIGCSWIVNFYKKRAVRIFPPLMFALIAAVVSKFMTFQSAIRQFFMLEKYSHFWVLPAELGFYVLFPVILVLIKKTGKYFCIIGSVIIVIIWLLYYFMYPQHSQNNLLYCLPLFILGITVSLMSHDKQIGLGGDCPKTQKSFLKVEDGNQYEATNSSEVVAGNNHMVCSDIKVENEDRSKLVFGQSVGGGILRRILMSSVV